MSKLPQFNRSSIDGGWYIVIAAVLWGSTGTAQAFAPANAQPMTVGLMRLFIGALALMGLAAYRGELLGIRHWNTWPKKTTLLAAVGIALYQVFFFAAVARTGVAVGTIVGIGSTPVAAGILVYLWHREKPGRRWSVATAMAILGCAFLILTGSSIQIDVLGIFLAIGAGASYALYTLLSKELLKQYTAGSFLTITFIFGVILLLPILIFGDLSWLREPRGLAVALHLGIVTVGFAYLLFAIGLTTIPVATAATLTLVEPLTAGLLGTLVLGEILNWKAIIGIGLIFGGLLVLSTKAQAPMIIKPNFATGLHSSENNEFS